MKSLNKVQHSMDGLLRALKLVLIFLIQVSIRSSSTNVDAGTPVNVTVQTSSAGAYVGLRAIDKSVLLLKSGNDISQNRVSFYGYVFNLVIHKT